MGLARLDILHTFISYTSPILVEKIECMYAKYLKPLWTKSSRYCPIGGKLYRT